MERGLNHCERGIGITGKFRLVFSCQNQQF
jgi:hypothetical protein